jgi:quinoprotein glucose dehydrogenase
MAAQFELAGRRDEATLAAVALQPGPRLARLHAIWGLGQIGTADRALPLLGDADAEARAQAARVLGDGRVAAAGEALLARLKDESPRVRFHAAMALGKLKLKTAIRPLLETVGDDRFVGHAVVTALASIGDVDALMSAAQEMRPPARLAVVLALRRMGRWEIRDFLTDPEVRFEAARAINDVPIPDGMRVLSMMVQDAGCPRPLLTRVINANFRLGDAGMLARFISGDFEPPEMRAEALKALADWERPSGRDRVLGVWRPLEPRDPGLAREALGTVLGDLLKSAPMGVKLEAIRAARALGGGDAETLRGLAAKGVEVPIRVEALRTLASRGDAALAALVRSALDEQDETLRRDVVRLLPQAKLAEGTALLERAAAEEGAAGVRQAALEGLAQSGPEADAVLVRLLDRLLAGAWPAPLRLELLEASGGRLSTEVRDRLAKVEASRRKEDPMSAWRECLDGGDPEQGRQVFWTKVHASCPQCHKIGEEGGTAGPPLSGIGARQTREFLLESLLFPSKAIAPGYETVAVQLDSDAVETGRVVRESASELVILGADGAERAIPKARIRQARRGTSAMPDDLGRLLTKRELRDLVEYLSTLK